MNIGERIRDYCVEHAKNEEDLSVAKIAAALEEDQHVVSFVLDSFVVDQDGSVKYVGTGAGGGWVPVHNPTPEEVLQRQLDDNIITQEDYDLRMELVRRGENPRNAEAVQRLLDERSG